MLIMAFYVLITIGSFNYFGTTCLRDLVEFSYYRGIGITYNNNKNRRYLKTHGRIISINTNKRINLIYSINYWFKYLSCGSPIRKTFIKCAF